MICHLYEQWKRMEITERRCVITAHKITDFCVQNAITEFQHSINQVMLMFPTQDIFICDSRNMTFKLIPTHSMLSSVLPLYRYYIRTATTL